MSFEHLLNICAIKDFENREYHIYIIGNKEEIYNI